MVENTINKPIESTVRKPYRLTDVTTKDEVINRLALDHKHQDIADSHNVSRQTIIKFKKRNLERINLVKQQFISDNLEAMRNQIKTDIDTSNRISQDYSNGKEFHPDATQFKTMVTKEMIKPLLTNLDIFPSRTNIQNFGNIQVNNQTNNVIRQEVVKMIGNAGVKQLEHVLNEDDYDVSDDTV